MPAAQDLTGQIFTRLTVVESTKKRDEGGGIIWKCICSCDTVKEASAKNLKRGDAKSCGCLKSELASQRCIARTKHGASKLKNVEGNSQLDYVIWQGIKRRCYNKNEENYKHYGARGIILCREWKKDFAAFAAYIRTLDNCPDDKILNSRSFGKRIPRTIDRIDNNGNYKPGNIKWSSRKEQNNNSSHNVIVKYKGKTMTLKEACELYSVVDYKTLYARYMYCNWSIEKSLTTPTQRKKAR